RALGDLLAQHLEVPGARLPPSLLGFGDDARERAGGGGPARARAADPGGVRRRRPRPPARARSGAGSRPRARGVGARGDGRRPGLGPPLAGHPGGPVGRPGRPAAPPPGPPALVRGGGLPRPPRAARGVDARHAGCGAGLAARPRPATPPAPSGAPGVPPISHPVLPLSAAEVDYPALRELHAASMLDTPEAVQAWRQGGPLPAPTPRGRTVALPPPRPAAGRGLGETILRRASTRQFSHEPLTAVELSTALAAATAPMAADGPGPLVWLYLIV